MEEEANTMTTSTQDPQKLATVVNEAVDLLDMNSALPGVFTAVGLPNFFKQELGLTLIQSRWLISILDELGYVIFSKELDSKNRYRIGANTEPAEPEDVKEFQYDDFVRLYEEEQAKKRHQHRVKIADRSRRREVKQREAELGRLRRLQEMVDAGISTKIEALKDAIDRNNVLMRQIALAEAALAALEAQAPK